MFTFQACITDEDLEEILNDGTNSNKEEPELLSDSGYSGEYICSCEEGFIYNYDFKRYRGREFPEV